MSQPSRKSHNVYSLKRWQSLVNHKRADVRFLTLLIPELESFYQEFRQIIVDNPKLRSCISDAVLAAHIRQDAIAIFLPMITKCCVIDMHTRKFNNTLNGDTSKDRFDDYIYQCQSVSTCQALWETYPVLENCIKTKIQHYQSAMSLFFTHLAEDIQQVEQDLLGDTLARITKFVASGDPSIRSGASKKIWLY